MNQFQSIESGKGALKNVYGKTPIYDALKRRNDKRKKKLAEADEPLRL
jgi:hypothetical protein